MTEETIPKKPTSDIDAENSCDEIEQECLLSKNANLIIVVEDENSLPLENATVEVTDLGTKFTDKQDGAADYGEVCEGSYTAKAEKEGYLPNEVEKTQFVSAQTTALILLKLKAVLMHMHVDADRDGKVDDDRTGLDKWEWGKGKKGAIILCNNDDDDSAGVLDNADDKINGGNDSDEIAPLVFRTEGGVLPLATSKGVLSVSGSDAKRIRIFNSKSAGGKEVIGPKAGKKYTFPNLNFTEMEFGMEATQYADDGFSGEITITFAVKSTAGKNYEEKAVVRAAPWVMPNHIDPASTVYVVDVGSVGNPWENNNKRFRDELDVLVTAAGCALEQYSEPTDRWMQDCMEIGYSNLPLKGNVAVTRAPRDRPLITFPKTLLSADFGYNVTGDLTTFTTFDSTGNLEVTPPATSKSGDKYPLGRIYYGPGRPLELIDPLFKAFLNKQKVQKPIEVDTGWLAVGHVDEIMTFVPAATGQGFKLLLASPKLAYEILKKKKASNGTDKLLTGRVFYEGDGEISIEDFLDVGIPNLSLTASAMDTFNKKVQITMDSVKAQFVTEIGIDPVTDVIEVPIIFMPNHLSPIFADALTAGMVNMLVLNKHCIVPKPFGPMVAGKDLFEEDLRKKLELLGLTVNFLDDWYEYHIQQGEIHCGTNTLRTPTIAKWWEFEP